MSRQLTISASIAVLSMAAFAMVASFGAMQSKDESRVAASAPLATLTIGR